MAGMNTIFIEINIMTIEIVQSPTKVLRATWEIDETPPVYDPTKYRKFYTGKKRSPSKVKMWNKMVHRHNAGVSVARFYDYTSRDLAQQIRELVDKEILMELSEMFKIAEQYEGVF